jgi:hypothetical protein
MPQPTTLPRTPNQEIGIQINYQWIYWTTGDALLLVVSTLPVDQTSNMRHLKEKVCDSGLLFIIKLLCGTSYILLGMFKYTTFRKLDLLPETLYNWKTWTVPGIIVL